MNIWMTFWTVLLSVAAFSFAVLLVLVSKGAIRELRQSLQELREDTRESAEHPEILDEAV